MTTVAELVAFLQAQRQDMLCAYREYSEQSLLELDQITIFRGCLPRPDGWVQNGQDVEGSMYEHYA